MRKPFHREQSQSAEKAEHGVTLIIAEMPRWWHQMLRLPLGRFRTGPGLLKRVPLEKIKIRGKDSLIKKNYRLIKLENKIRQG